MPPKRKRSRADSWATRQAKSKTRDVKLETALLADRGDSHEMSYVATSMIHAALAPLYRSGDMADLAVTCGGRSFHLHKAIVCPQSSFFNAACNSGFIEGAENKICLPEDDPDTLDRFFEFLYSGNYSDGEHFDGLPSRIALMPVQDVVKKLAQGGVWEDLDDGSYTEPDSDEEIIDNDTQLDSLEFDSEVSQCTEAYSDSDQDKGKADFDRATGSSLIISLRVYSMADKYDVPALKVLSKERFVTTAEQKWLAGDHDEFPAVVDELWETTSPHDPLRNFVCRLIQGVYRKDPDVRAKMRLLMEKHSDLAVTLLESVIGSEDLSMAGVA